MIASVVAIPETDAARTSRSPSPSLKRKLSGTSSPDSKRIHREDSDVKAQDEPPRSDAQPVSSRRNRTTAQEEKKRTQRLFSSLLGTLSQRGASQNSASTARRAEIEQRQRDRLRKDTEEREAESQRRRDEVLQRRRREQVQWDEEGREVRWKNERWKAGFLQTRTQPVLFWRPWELKGEEVERVKRQREEVERRIEGERRAAERPPSGDGVAKEVIQKDLTVNERGDSSGQYQQDGEQNGLAEQPPQESVNASADIIRHEGQTQPDLATDAAEAVNDARPPAPVLHERDAEDDHQEGVLVEGEGQEDDILY